MFDISELKAETKQKKKRAKCCWTRLYLRTDRKTSSVFKLQKSSFLSSSTMLINRYVDLLKKKEIDILGIATK